MHALERTDRRPGNRAEWRVAGALLAALPLFTACVSKDLQTAPKKTPPAVAINLQGQQPPLVAVLHTVICFEGPGSWKREAYWDEYVLSVVNQGDAPIDIDSASLFSSAIATQSPGSDPWQIEKESHKVLKDHTLSRQIVAGAGGALGVWTAEAGATAVAAGALATGSTVAVAGAVVAIVALPVFLVGSGVRGYTAHHEIEKEFKLRRLALPLHLQPGEVAQGSLFFPITPGPQRLEMNFGDAQGPRTLTVDLAPLSDLHFQADPAGVAPSPPAR